MRGRGGRRFRGLHRPRHVTTSVMGESAMSNASLGARPGTATARPAARIAVIYALVGLAWILFSDLLLEWVARDRATLTRVQTYKGYFFILTTAYLLYVLIRGHLRVIRESQRALGESEQRYRSLVDAMPAPIVVHADRTILFANGAAADLMGVARGSDMVGMMGDDFLMPPSLEVAAARIQRMAKEGKPLAPVEYQMVRRDGTMAHIDVRTIPFTYGGRPVALSLVHDITARKRAEGDLKREHGFLTAVLDTAGALVVVLDREARIVTFNRACERTTGYAFKDVRGKTLWEALLLPDELDVVKDVFAKLLSGDFLNNHENCWATADGDRRLIAWSNTVLRDSNGRVEYVVGTGLDITDQRRAEEALRREHGLLTSTMETSPAGITVLDRDGHITFANARAEHVLGLAREDMTQRTYNAAQWHITDYDGEPFPDDELPFHRVMTTGKAVYGVRFAAQRPDGHRVLLSVNGAPLFDESGDVVGVVATVEDVTLRVKAEQELRESQRALSTLVSNLPGMVYRCTNDEKWTMEYVSEGCLDLTGHKASDLQYNRRVSFADLIRPEDRRGVWDGVQTALAKSEPFKLTYRIVAADGHEKWVWEQGRATGKSPDGTEMLEGFIVDITDRVRAVEALRESEQMLRLLFDHANDGINITEYDAETHGRRLVDCNERYVEMSGRSREELEVVEDLNALNECPHSLAEKREWDGRILAGAPFHGTASWIRPDAEENYFEWTATPMKRGDRMLIFGVDRDITERKKAEADRRQLEQQLTQARKLEAIGKLAGGVAHDFNNLLTGIIGYANLLKMDAEPGGEVAQCVDAIEAAARRGGQLTAQLLTFARRGHRENVDVDMHKSLADAGDLLGASLGKDITIEQDLQADPHVIRGDAAAIQQVILNLAVNARDAMPQGGRLRIETTVADLGLGDPRLQEGLPPGPYVVLLVADTGGGIPREVVDRIFEPFFTTKGPGKGTGMGLATVYGIVRDHGGVVHVDSKVGRGTTFRVYLPLAGGAAG